MPSLWVLFGRGPKPTRTRPFTGQRNLGVPVAASGAAPGVASLAVAGWPLPALASGPSEATRFAGAFEAAAGGGTATSAAPPPAPAAGIASDFAGAATVVPGFRIVTFAGADPVGAGGCLATGRGDGVAGRTAGAGAGGTLATAPPGTFSTWPGRTLVGSEMPLTSCSFASGTRWRRARA